MQALYPNRINFENFPSINTPLGESTLNKIDYAVYGLDQRVLSLYGYESRVAQSEKKAKASETNAKTSETNAKQSELKAKEYMENAFSGTPEGYEKLVEDVRLMDIQTTTDTTLLNSKAGGYKLLSMSGNSVQNETPTPDAPQSIHNVGDCVEIEIGGFSSAGVPTSATKVFRNKRRVSCNTTGIITLKFPYPMYSTMYFFDANGNEIGTYAYPGLTLKHSMTIPNGSTGFDFACGGVETIDFATLGKIELTINGKYVVQIVENGKNEFKNVLASGTYLGVVVTSNEGGTLTLKGTTTSVLAATLGSFVFKANEKYHINGLDSSYGDNVRLDLRDSSGAVVNIVDTDGIGTTVKFSVDITCALVVRVSSGYTVDCLISPMIRKADITDDIYEPYKEKVAKVLLNEPLRESDVMSRTEVVRKRASVVFDGSADEGWSLDTVGRMITTNYANLIKITPNNATVPNALCSQYSSTSADNTYLHNMGISYGTSGAIHVYDSKFTTLAEWLTHLSSNPMEFEFELAEEVVEILDTDSQIALNSLETFDTVTYINVDSRVQPSEIKGEYGTSKVGARTIKNELRNDTLEIKYNELAVALVATESGV